jgi:hypothetical protein
MKAVVYLWAMMFVAHWVRGQDEELRFGVCLTGHERTMYEPAVRPSLHKALCDLTVVLTLT